MELKTTFKIHRTLLMGVLFLGTSSIFAQNQIFATRITNEQQVDLSANAIDSNLQTQAEIRASSGFAAGLGAYSGNLEIEFPQSLSANTTSYVKIDTEDHLLACLIGGNLGTLLADIAGTILVGNQEFTVEAKNGNTTILSGSSNTLGSLSNNSLRVVVNSTNDYFLAVTPSNTYNRISLTNSLGSVIGLNNTRRLSVSGAYTNQGTDDCGTPDYTSFSGNGLTLDLLNLGGAGVVNPSAAIDGNPNTFSQLGLGLIGVAADIEQTIYFNAPSNSDDSIFIQLALDPSLLQASIANNVEVVAQNGPDNAVFSGKLSSFLNVDVLGLLQSDNIATIEVRPETSFDRLTIRLSSLLNASLDQQIRIHDIYTAPSSPTIDVQSEDSSVCKGSSANLFATAEGGDNLELRWYDAPTGGNLLAIVDSGEAFITPELTADTTFYVASAKTTCSKESPRVPLTVSIVNVPEADDINIIGAENPLCSSSEVVLKPSSTTVGTFSWYFDAAGTNEITDGIISGGVSYTIESDGTLLINGLDEANSPYTFYSKLTGSSSVCENTLDNLKPVVLNITDSDFQALVNITSILTIEDLINIFQGSPSITVNGNVSGDADTGDMVTLFINDAEYNGTIDSNSNFSIPVNGTDLVQDLDGEIITVVSNGICSIGGRRLIEIPDLPIDNLLQVFCESDLALVSDLQFDRSIIVLYESINGEAIVDENRSLKDGEKFFAGIPSIPISVMSRVEITVKIISVSPPTTSTMEQTFCESDNPVIGDIQVNEQDVVFYDSPENGNELDTSTPLEDGKTYYAANRESGCESITRLEITTYLGNEEPVVISGEFEEVCLNREYTYTTESNKENYVWTVSGGTITNGGTSTDDFASVRWTELQGTEISISYTDTDNCISDAGAEYTVEIINVPPPTTSSTEQTFCESDNPVIGDIQVNEQDIVFYDSAEESIPLDPSTPLEDSKTYYVANGESGCESTSRLEITTYLGDEEPVVISGEFEEVCQNREYIYTTESNKENYVWTVSGGTITNGGTSTDDFAIVRWTELQGAEISVSYTDTDNCLSQAGANYTVAIVSCGEVLGEEFSLIVYNEFTPNNDGFNDFFKVEGLEEFANTVEIYNRNGNLVFSDEDYQNNWDGIANVNAVLQRGKHLPSGTYYYVINIPELERELVGWLQLAR